MTLARSLVFCGPWSMELTRLVSGNESNRIEPNRTETETSRCATPINFQYLLKQLVVVGCHKCVNSQKRKVTRSYSQLYTQLLTHSTQPPVESIQRFLFICQVFPRRHTNISKVFQEVSSTFLCLPPSDMLMWSVDTDSMTMEALVLAWSTSIYHLNGWVAV